MVFWHLLPAVVSVETIYQCDRGAWRLVTHRKYDRYCSWIHATIGERTIRWFILFIISCLYLASCAFIGFASRFKFFVFKEFDLPDDRMAKVKHYMRLCFTQIPDLTCATVGTGLSVIVMLRDLFGIVRRVSRNILTAEAAKYRKLRKQRKEIGIKEPPNNMYDKGFCYNWMEVLCP